MHIFKFDDKGAFRSKKIGTSVGLELSLSVCVCFVFSEHVFLFKTYYLYNTETSHAHFQSTYKIHSKKFVIQVLHFITVLQNGRFLNFIR